MASIDVGCSKGRLCTIHTCSALVYLYWIIFRYRNAFLTILSWAFVTLISGNTVVINHGTHFNAMKYISDSVISLQEAPMLCPAQDTSSQSSGRMDSPTPSAGERIQSHSGTSCLNNSVLLKGMKKLFLLRVSRQHSHAHSIFKQLGQGEGSSLGKKTSLLGQIPASRPTPSLQGLGSRHQASHVHGLPAREVQHGEGSFLTTCSCILRS